MGFVRPKVRYGAKNISLLTAWQVPSKRLQLAPRRAGLQPFVLTDWGALSRTPPPSQTRHGADIRSAKSSAVLPPGPEKYVPWGGLFLMHPRQDLTLNIVGLVASS
jgi:hypothetical protein